MEKINKALAQITGVLKAMDTFEAIASSGDFEKMYSAPWPDIKSGLEAVSLIKTELQIIQKEINYQMVEGAKHKH